MPLGVPAGGPEPGGVRRETGLAGTARQQGLTEDDIRRIVCCEFSSASACPGPGQAAAFIASGGTLDQAYPPLILAATAAASGMHASCYGLNIIRTDSGRLLKVSPLGNPAIPVPVPSLVLGLPGMGPAAKSTRNELLEQQEERASSSSTYGKAKEAQCDG
jgi:peroxiredoxin family protein